MAIEKPKYALKTILAAQTERVQLYPLYFQHGGTLPEVTKIVKEG